MVIKTLDRYLLRHYLQALGVVVLAVGLTIIVVNMVEQLRDFIDHHVPLISILEYYLYFGGWVVKSFFPLFVMLAALFSVSLLARKNELLAMKASGVSLYRIAAPIIVVTIIMAAAHFYYNEYVFPAANQRRLELKEFTIERRARSMITSVNDVYRQVSPGEFYLLATFNTDRKEGHDFKFYRTEKNELRQWVTAARIGYLDHGWVARDGMVRNFDSSGETFFKFDSLVLPYIKDKPEDLGKRLGRPEDMGLDELQRYIDLMKRTGGPYLRESIDLRLKYAYPVTSVIVLLISIPFAANPRRGGVAVSFAVGALIALVYFVLFRTMQSAGYNGKVSPEIAVWGINGLFFVIGAALMLRARK